MKENLRNLSEIKETSQVVRNDITQAEQERLLLRIANRRKVREILHISKGNGQTLKCEENPVLVPLLEYPFVEARIFVNEEGEVFNAIHICKKIHR